MSPRGRTVSDIHPSPPSLLRSCLGWVSGALTYCAILVVPAHATEWDLTPSVALAETYTNNVFLAPSGGQGDWVTSVNPGLRLTGQGRRISADLDYLMQNLFYARFSDENQTYNQFRGNLNAELLKDSVFLDARGNASQQVVNPDGRVSSSNIPISNNLTNTTSWVVSPYWQPHFGESIEGELRYTAGWLNYSGNDLPDSEQQSVSAKLGSKRGAGGAGWEVRYRNDRVDYEDTSPIDNESPIRFESVNLLGYYSVGGYTDLVVLGGYENNDYQVLPGEDDPEGPIWAVGIRSERARSHEFVVLGGERYFGPTYLLRWRQIGRRGDFTVSHTDDLRTSTQVVLDLETAIDPAGNLPQLGLISSQPAAFRERLSTVSLTWNSPKTATIGSLFYADREYVTAVADQELSGANLTWRWAFRPRTNLTVIGQWQDNRYKQNGTLSEYTLLFARIGMDRRLSEQWQAGLFASYSEQDSRDETLSYREGEMSVSLRGTF